MPPNDNPTSLNGWTYFSSYLNYTLYHRSDDAPHEYAAGNNEKVWVYDHSFNEIRSQLDEITGAG